MSYGPTGAWAALPVRFTDVHTCAHFDRQPQSGLAWYWHIPVRHCRGAVPCQRNVLCVRVVTASMRTCRINLVDMRNPELVVMLIETDLLPPYLERQGYAQMGVHA
uniref:Uncharacterized protein n=1 Tax=Dunaliella tertiolecta TaxID=3047 RepID=A0A7S3VUQ5_DUNTE|eukprot:989966-Pelagomonas_calceolata.AAC.1